jgi:hypothetical protein
VMQSFVVKPCECVMEVLVSGEGYNVTLFRTVPSGENKNGLFVSVALTREMERLLCLELSTEPLIKMGNLCLWQLG